MRSLEESRARWQITAKQATSRPDLRKAVRADGDENPCKSGLRSVCWKTFLLFQTTETTGWSRALIDSRSAYSSLREHLLRYIKNPDALGSALDPLDDDQNSPWNTLRQDEELRAEIFQDIQRCMQEEPYFRQPRTQRIMLDILFVFCKINQDVGYRQGMHELLAPILWVIDQDAIDLANSNDQGSGSETDSLLKQILDPAYIEHDAFTLLSLIMRTAKSFYELGETDLRSNAPSAESGTPPQKVSPIVERSERIHEVYLARVDPELAKHLTDIEVLPQIFLIRWIRLLFGREFPFDDLLALWDVLLAEDPELDLVDMVCVAMLLRIRWQLLEANYSVALMLLLKYPSPSRPHDPRTFVDDAIYLRNNFSAAGGATLIAKYSGKSPPVYSSASRPSTPLGEGVGQKHKLWRARSPLQTPVRFLQQQGGVEALFQGAAKGVFDRGERLGINQAVRDAVGEVKKNMKGLHASRITSPSRRTSDMMRWSLDEGRSVPSQNTFESAMKTRNQQLALMLDEAMADLRDLSVSTDDDKDKYIKGIDLAIAKIGFVKVYLEDSEIPLPFSPSNLAPESPSSSIAKISPKSPEQAPSQRPAATRVTTTAGHKLKTASSSDLSLPSTPTPESLTGESSPAVQSSSDVVQDPLSKTTVEPAEDIRPPSRPISSLPTRSSIAQSNFSWMLEPDDSSASGVKSAPLKSSSPFLKSGRRPNSGQGREKAAFLFGEESGEPQIPSSRKSVSAESFSLGPMKGGEDNNEEPVDA